MSANILDHGPAPELPQRGEPAAPRPHRPKPPSNARSAKWLVAGLILLSVIPIASGAFRLSQLAGGAPITPANARFFASPLPVVLHILSVTLYALLGAFQFVPSLRRRRHGWHRAAGWIVLPSGLIVALSGLWMTLVYRMPAHDGALVYALRLLFGSAMLLSLLLGIAALVRRDFARHGSWMLRGYAIGMGAGTQVLTGMVASTIVDPPTELSRALLMGSAWAINLAVAEWIIHKHSRHSARQKERTMTHKIVEMPRSPSATALREVQQLLRHPRRAAVALALAAIVALLGGLARPSPPSLSTAVTGNAALAARARPLLHGALDRVSIAVVDGSTVTYAHFGADEHTQYEIGSLTKTFTALLLADAIGRGEVTADTKVGALLPLAGAPIADVSLAELASHRSGLSAQGMQLDDTIPFVLRYFRHRDPFTHDVAGVLAIARRATLADRGSFVYSNLGVALLGHALAAAAQTDYAQLVQERLLTPLGMAETSLPLTPKNLPAGAPTGYSAAGIAEAPWTIDGWAPAGGARSTAADLARYAQALLEGTAPGVDALAPRWQFGALQVGYVWTTQEYHGHTVTYKNGLTGGFTSKVILDRAHRRAVIVLSNTAAQVDEAANRLLIGEQP